MKHYPLTAKDVKKILKNLGFLEGKQNGTSHVHWTKIVTKNGKRHKYKVTVDSPKAPFSQDLIGSMANQAGLTKKQFYAALGKAEAKKLTAKLEGKTSPPSTAISPAIDN